MDHKIDKSGLMNCCLSTVLETRDKYTEPTTIDCLYKPGKIHSRWEDENVQGERGCLVWFWNGDHEQ